MTDSSVQKLLDLHTAFWNRTLEQPIINIDCSVENRHRHIPALPKQWEGKDGLMLEPEMLSPQEFQPPPISVNEEHPLYTEAAFNTFVPYSRVPWLPGIMGCGLKVSTSSQTVWPISYLKDNWYELPNQGFVPRLEWLEKLLEFVSYIVDCYYPDRCIPAQDLVVRSPGDLCLAMLGPERFYTGFFDHPDEMKLLLAQITDIYIHWGQAQLDLIPQVHGGYCNQYGIWSPGTCLRTQEDYAVNLSPQIFAAFIMPCLRRVAEAFDYSVIHTHSGCPQLAEWALQVDALKAIEVCIDPTGPTLEESIPLWNRILAEKPLIVSGPATQDQLDILVSRLTPSGLLLDLELVTEEELASAWALDKTTSTRSARYRPA